LAVDVYYVANGRLRWTYLLDGVMGGRVDQRLATGPSPGAGNERSSKEKDQMSDRPREQGSPSPDHTTEDGTAAGMDQQDVTGRAELARWLQPHIFPATPVNLMQSATETGAPGHIIGMLARLPQEETFQNMQDVWRALGGGTEDTEHRA
jgi:hypothetical protein